MTSLGTALRKFPITLAVLILGIAFGGCGGNEPAAPLQVASDELSSKKTGEITIVLEMRPEIPTEVPFAFQHKKFSLVDDGGPTLSNTHTFDKLKVGTYTVEMTSAPDGSLTQIVCESSGTENNTIDLASRTATVTLEAGESVVCTFVDGWEPGDGVTFTETALGTSETAQSVLESNFFTVYATAGLVEIGIPGAAGFSDQFSGPTPVENYLPRSGTPAPLTADLADPTSDSSGIFGGEVLALTINVDFSDAGVLDGSGTRLGDLVLCGLSTTSLNGMTVRQLLSEANVLLGGGSSSFTIPEVLTVAIQVNQSFPGTSVSQFAQDHLFVGACP